MRKAGFGALGASIAALLTGTALAQQTPEEHPSAAKVVQVLRAFDNPEGAIFSADGKSLFVSNAAEIGDKAQDFGWTEGAGYVSKLEVSPSGELNMVNEKLITGLTGPLGMAVLPVGTEKFPAGTIFLGTGNAPTLGSEGEAIKDPSRLQSKLLAFGPEGGKLGEIGTGPGSAFEEISGQPVLLLNALGFDSEGNLYFADTALGGAQFDPPFEGQGGVWMVPVGSLDALAEGGEVEDKPRFLPMPGAPDGVEVSPADGKIYVNTVGPAVGTNDPAKGGVYALSKDDFPADGSAGNLPAPVEQGLGALDGLDFTAGGAMLNTQIIPDVAARIYVSCPGETATTLSIEGSGTDAELSGPADLAVLRSADGPQLVAIPELMARDATPGDDEVTIISLPENFDASCG
jgi:hypothetical protein